MKLTALLKKIGELLNPLRAALPEDRDARAKESGDAESETDARKTPKKDFLPEAGLTPNIDRYRHPSEF